MFRRNNELNAYERERCRALSVLRYLYLYVVCAENRTIATRRGEMERCIEGGEAVVLTPTTATLDTVALPK